MISIKGELATYLKRRSEMPIEQLAEFDQLIWERFGIECAILVSDSSQFSYKAQVLGIIHYLNLIFRSHEMLFPILRRHEGELLKAEADNMLAIFPTVENAVSSAIEMNQVLADYNASVSADEEYCICIGIGWGRVLRSDNEIFGDEANAAYKLGEDVAKKNEILLTAAVREKLDDKMEYTIRHHRMLNLSSFCFDSYKLEIPANVDSD
ncbi:adenylate/guanylate cyclase domain-containing protein [candidate division KSB1 bacterium]|nr:adenylate/guanylate cyclase domain-containing protein [candidate division KSB1 bacterium]